MLYIFSPCCCSSWLVRLASTSLTPATHSTLKSHSRARISHTAIRRLFLLTSDRLFFFLCSFRDFLLLLSRLMVLNSQPRLFIYFISLPTSSLLLCHRTFPTLNNIFSLCFFLLAFLLLFVEEKEKLRTCALRKWRKFHDFIVDDETFYQVDRSSGRPTPYDLSIISFCRKMKPPKSTTLLPSAKSMKKFPGVLKITPQTRLFTPPPRIRFT